MNELVLFKKMTSMQIAEVVRKRHADVMRDIRDEIEKLEKCGVANGCMFALVEYTDAKGEKRPCYELSEKGVLQLAARYDAVTRAKLIEMAMRQEQSKVPQSFAEALRLAADLEEEKQALVSENAQQKQIIGELKPRADYTDAILRNKGLVTITQIAKDYGMSGNEMNELLHERGVQYNQSKQWLLYAKYQDKGYTHSQTINITRKDGRPDIEMHTKWTQKGRLFIYSLLKESGILPVIERKGQEGIASRTFSRGNRY